LQFNSNVGNVVDLANILLAMHESCLLRQIRNLAGDKEDALNIATDAIKLFEMSNQSINCILIGNIYIAYANSLYDLNGDINEIVKAWEQAIRYYKMAGMDDSHEEIKKMKYNLQSMKDIVN